MMFKPNPGDESDTKGQIEESFVRDGEYDEDRREGKEDNDESMKIVIIRMKAVEEWYTKRCDCENRSALVMWSRFVLQGAYRERSNQ